MTSEIGNILKVKIFGASHAEKIGVEIENLPENEAVDTDELLAFMARRRPGKDSLSTGRNEKDLPVFTAGIENGVTTGQTLCAEIVNTDMRSKDYSGFTVTPRPGHADYTAQVKFDGKLDMRGGGHFSGRMTAPLCIAGAIAKQILARKGIFIGAHICEIGGVADDGFPLLPEKQLFDEVAAKAFPVINDEKGEKMKEVILDALSQGDSVGGIVECAVIGIPAGVGNAMFAGVEGRLSLALFGIPAVKGVEFGAGFDCARLRGSQNNDKFYYNENGQVTTETNNCGGILGGITNAMPVTFRVAFKPTPSISKTQKTVNLQTGENAEITVGGRHDPCVVHRAVPVVEAAAAITVLDMILEESQNGY